MSENQGYVPPTVSPVCNMLLDRLERAYAGEIDAKSLALIAVEQLALTDKTRNEMLAKLEAPTTAVLKVDPQIVESVRESLDTYSQLLRDILSYIETGDESLYQTAVEGLLELGSCGRLIFEGYTPQEGEMGPTPMPMLNVLVHVCEGYTQGYFRREAIERTITNIALNSRLAASELEQNEEADLYLRDTLVRIYCDFAEAVEELRQYLDQGQEATRPQLQAITDAGKALRDGIENFTASMATRGPSKMAQANLILNIAKSWRSGRLAPEAFMRSLEQFRSNVDDLWREVESLGAIPVECPEIAEQLITCREAFEDHFRAIDMFAATLAGQEDLFDQASELLVQAADALYDSKERFDNIGEQSSKVYCVRCGAPNDAGSRACISCGAKMLDAAAASGTSSTSTMSFQEDGGQPQYGGELVMTKNLLTVFETVNKAAEGRIDVDEYNAVLDWFSHLVEDNILSLPPSPEMDGSGLEGEGAAELHSLESQLVSYRAEIDAGAQAMLEAVERLRLFAADNNSINLVEGVRALRDASIRVQRATRGIEEVVASCRAQANNAT